MFRFAFFPIRNRRQEKNIAGAHRCTRTGGILLSRGVRRFPSTLWMRGFRPAPFYYCSTRGNICLMFYLSQETRILRSPVF